MTKNSIIYAIIPARSGSKGLPNKNIKLLNNIPLLAYSINFAKALKINKVICSTDSEEYARLAKSYGAEVPFLRGQKASSDIAMEEDILLDLYEKFDEFSIPYPDLFIWLRPTFVFRDLDSVKICINTLISDKSYTAARTVCESEARLYKLNNSLLKEEFDDKGKSMIRRQEIGEFYKVFSTDVFRGNPKNCGPDFLGRKVFGIKIPKICGLDIDDEDDFKIVEIVIKNNLNQGKYIY